MFYTKTQKKMNQMSSRLERQNMFISVCVEQEYATIFPKTLVGQKHSGVTQLHPEQVLDLIQKKKF